MAVPDELSSAPPSAKLIYYALRRDGPLSYSELKTQTKLPETTLTRGITTLEAADRIAETGNGYVLRP